MINPQYVWLVTQPVDMRSGIDKLTAYLQQHLGAVWQQQIAFVFTNKSRSRIKVLRWDEHGVWLCQRRLHHGRFPWIKSGETHWSLSPEQFIWLMKGVDWQRVEGLNLSRFS